MIFQMLYYNNKYYFKIKAKEYFQHKSDHNSQYAQ